VLRPGDEALLREIAGRSDEIVALTQELIRFPTVNPPGDGYRACAEYLGERLRKRGFQVEYVRAEGAPGDSGLRPRMNVIARHEGAGPGPCVHFNSHIDVVEAGQGWTVPPFEGVVKDGKVFGRGACDMKGGLAASVIAVEALIDSGISLPGALEISGTADEESGGYGGVAYLAGRGYFSRPRVDYVIIPEPLNVDRVCIGHRGVWWSEITTHGRSAHGSMPFLGDNAVRHMGAVLDEIERRIIPGLSGFHTRMPVAPEGARTPTLNINSIHGGQMDASEGGLPSPVVPDSCRMILDRRLLIEEDLDSVKAEMRAMLDGLVLSRRDFRYSMRDLFDVRPSMTEPDRPVVRLTCEAVEQVLGKPAEICCSPGTYDQKHIDRIGKLRDCIAYGPGILDLAHQPDEYVVIEDMVQSAQVMALAAYSLLIADQA
jgi:succinyl-diaminopimelate desuccinylase